MIEPEDDGKLYEYQIPVSREVKWWTPGRMEVSGLPRAGWKKYIARGVVKVLQWLGCSVLLDHEIYIATRVETIKRDCLHHLLYDVYNEMMRHNERPWMVLVPYEKMVQLKSEFFKDYWPFSVEMGKQLPDVHYGMKMGRENFVFTIGPGIPVYVSPWVKEIVIVPDVRQSAEQYKPFSWVLKEVKQFYQRDTYR